MEWESDSPRHSHTHPEQGHRSLRWHRGWELKCRDCGAIPGWGLLLTVERLIKGMWGRRLGWENCIEESQTAMGAGWYCRVTCREWSHHHSLSLSTRQHWQLNNREAGPLNAYCIELKSRTPTQGATLSAWCTNLQSRTPARGILYVPDAPNSRERPQAREPSKYLNGQSYGERLAKEAFWSPATRSLKKDTDRAITPVVEVVHVPAHLTPPGSPQPKQLYHLHIEPSLVQSCHRQKKILCLCTWCHFGRVCLCDPVDSGLPGFSVKGVGGGSPGKNTGYIG